MELDTILKAQRETDDSISLTILDRMTGEKVIRRFADIRMGIHWPTCQSAACFVVVSQQYSGHQHPGEGVSPDGKREVIAEYVSESFGLNTFYQQIVDLNKKTLCKRIYAVLPEDRENFGHLRDLEAHMRRSECDFYVHDATDGVDFFLSLSRIKDSHEGGNLVVPGNTIVFDQLKGITREDLHDCPEERFNCIDALGHVINGYYRQPPRNSPLRTKRRPPPDWRYH